MASADSPPQRGLDPGTLRDLRAVEIEPARPLLVVDADEVLVEFAGHLARFAEGAGVEMALKRYELEGAFTDRATGRILGFQEAIGLIDRFFDEETRTQRPIPGAVEALSRLSARAQVVVLSNVPRHARDARAENLASLGMGFPVIANSGGKGRALAWLAARLAPGTPAVFVDDSPNQIESAKARAPEILRIQLRTAAFVAHLIPASPAADHDAADWAAAEAAARAHLG